MIVARPEHFPPFRPAAAGAGRADALAAPAVPGLVERLIWRGRPSRLWMGSVAIVVTIAALLPLGFILWVAVETGWATDSALIFRGRVGELLVNTLLLLAVTLPLCALLAVALAWLTERSDLPGARIWAWLAVAPLAVPAFVHSYAWISLAPGFDGFPAAVMISVLAYFPFVYLPLAAALRRLDPGLEDAAASLGLAPWHVFLRVVLPQLRLALCGGLLLVGLHLLGEYGLYGMIRFDTFTTAIVEQFQSTFNGPAANMLAGVLAIFCLALLAGEAGVRGKERYARIGSGAARAPQPRRLGRSMSLCLLLPVLTAILSLGVPAVTLARWLFDGGAGVWRLGEIGPALGETMMLALVGALLTTLAATPMAWLSIRAPGRLQRVLEGCNYVIGSLPGAVVALALVTITVRVALPIYQTIVTLLIAYAMLFLPLGLISMRVSIAQAPIELEQAAASLGRPPLAALWSTTMRLAAPGAAASMALVSLGITTELTATQMLAPNGTQTLTTAFWAYSGELDYASAAPYALIMVLFSLPLTVLLYLHSKRTAGR